MSQEVMGKILEDRVDEAKKNFESAKRAYEQAKLIYTRAVNEYSQWRNPK